MSEIAKYSGDAMVLKFGTIDISAQARSLDVSQSAAEIDVTSYASTDKEFISGMRERTATSAVLDDASSSVVRTALQVGSSGSLTWFPIGTASGNPKFQVATAVVLKQDFSYPYDDAVMFSTDWRLSGPVVESTASGTGL